MSLRAGNESVACNSSTDSAYQFLGTGQHQMFTDVGENRIALITMESSVVSDRKGKAMAIF